MRDHIILAAIFFAFFQYCYSFSAGVESIKAVGLLGSHFGIPGLNATYDFVIIGGGTAGLAVARRLAENSSVTVAVIEAGDFPQFSNGNYSEVPAYASEFTGNNPTEKNPYLDWYMYTTPQTTRSSSLEYFKEALVESNNVVLYKSTMAKKVIFKEKKAIGVMVESGGEKYHITAKKEVVVSAGVMRSPQLLMVSGIGPSATLRAYGVDVIADRPGVGQNLSDNVLVGPTYQVEVTTHNSLADPAFLADSINQYNINRTGMLTNVGGDVSAFEKLPLDMISVSTMRALNESFPEDWPHIQYLVLDEYFGSGTDSSSGLKDMRQYVAASVGLVATFSRGNVTITSADVRENPVISPNWLADPRDQEVAIAAFRRGRQLFQTASMNPVVVSEAFPGANYTSDSHILEIIRESANSVYNAVGTNRMGRKSDPWAVVDSRCRVIGVQSLRVVDASAFPFLPPGQPSATVYALAEKIAEDMRAIS
ncbi:glucose-methanol-choline oxidoreductase [Penicillium angulare]|uniref:glucose-methanol-choline oxidoreductase n=1 Tax=Penicillium angulare TaxID=116970 RepID=UPI002540019E|nr:glucose-methanol-choline oxidoreductase [Penicillium angulare]KAJ5274031.1 glucose-methanol-choline oxidoreductase [Penicillium angulare]